MSSQIIILIAVVAVMFSVIGGLSLLAHYCTLSGIKSKTVKDFEAVEYDISAHKDWNEELQAAQGFPIIPNGEREPQKLNLVLHI